VSKTIGSIHAKALKCHKLLFANVKSRCEASAFSAKEEKANAHDAVLEAVLRYFSQGVTNPALKVYETMLPPIYFQHPGT
jgi:hypothetical protein